MIVRGLRDITCNHVIVEVYLGFISFITSVDC